MAPLRRGFLLGLGKKAIRLAIPQIYENNKVYAVIDLGRGFESLSRTKQ